MRSAEESARSGPQSSGDAFGPKRRENPLLKALFFRYEKNKKLELPISARPRKKKTLAPRKRSTKSLLPSRGWRVLLRFLFALGCGYLRSFWGAVHFEFCSLLSKIQRPIILEDRPARFWGKRSKQEKVYISRILVTIPGFAIRLG